jgi:N-acyl-D-amino-acid deacylase
VTGLYLRGGLIVSGLDEAPFEGTIGVAGDRIVEVTRGGDPAPVEAQSADATIVEVSGLIVCPGFIDAHVHGEKAALVGGPLPEATMQGVTTYIVGQDGCSFAPGSASWLEYVNEYFGAVNGRGHFVSPPLTVAGFLDLVDRRSTVNVATLVPNGNLRFDAMGLQASEPSRTEAAQMAQALAQGLAEGAVGLSSGMDYIPSRMAGAAEIASLCGVLADADAVYVSHVRGYGNRVGEGLGEIFEVARSSGAPIHISHLWGPAEAIASLLDSAAGEGIDCSLDTYPYTAGCSILAMALLPAELQADGPDATLERLADSGVRAELRKVVALDQLELLTFGSVASDAYAWCEGRTLLEGAADVGAHPVDLACDVLVASRLDVGVIMGRRDFGEADMTALLRHDLHMLSSDGIFVGRHPHPRGWGAFARALGLHTVRRRDYTWPEAVRHLATNAARRFGLVGRGVLEPGAIADIAVVEPTSVSDLSTYAWPRQTSRGVRHVLVSGISVLRNGELTGATPGRAIRRGT